VELANKFSDDLERQAGKEIVKYHSSAKRKEGRMAGSEGQREGGREHERLYSEKYS
jgi:hypothetical protein